MIRPAFELPPKPDASGQEVALHVMPRTTFPELGAQIGIRLVTSRDGESIYEQTVGVSDHELDSLILALQQERRRRA